MSRSLTKPMLPTAVFFAATLAPVSATAQLNTCDVFFERAGHVTHVQTSSGFIRQFIGGGVVARCLGKSNRMLADSVAYFEDQLRIVFVGNVRFEDSTAVLESDRAFYFLADEKLEAYGNAHLTNLNTGTTLSGPNLTYLRAAPGIRDVEEMFASQRPTINYQPDSTSVEPYVIIANQVRMRGNSQTWAGGNVTIDRSDFRAKGDSTELDMAQEEGVLIGHAFVEGGDSSNFTVSGREIGFTFAEGDLNWVQSRGLADARNPDFGLVADTIEFVIEDDVIQGAEAWGDSIRPQAVSNVNTIVADSLAIDSPDQRLEEIRAFGNARATSVRDSFDIDADWVAGDTVTARFGNALSGERILSELDALGSAIAYYRIFDPESDGPPNLNYSRGLKIMARFDDHGVDRVDIIGEADGVHLEPVRIPPQ